MSASVTVLDGVVRRHEATAPACASLGSGPPPVEGKPASSRTTLPEAAPKAAAQEMAPETRLREQNGRDWVRRYRTVLPPGSSPTPEPQPAAAETPQPAAAEAAPQPVEAEASLAEDEPEPEHDDTPGRRGRGHGHAHGRDRDDR